MASHQLQADMRPTITLTHLKTPEESRRTATREARANRGFLTPRALMASFVVALGGLVLAPWLKLGLRLTTAVVGLWGADFASYVVGRRRLLAEFAAGRPRMDKESDVGALTAAYRQTGRAVENMSDYEAAAGLSGHAEWRTGMRYNEIIQRLRTRLPIDVLADVGCGDGRLAWRYGAHTLCKTYIGIDASSAMLTQVAQHLPDARTLLADASRSIPLPDESVDVIVCTECFEHMATPETTLREFARLLKPGGWIIIQSPNAAQLRNFNPLHALQCILGMWMPRILLPIVVHEQTFVRVYTYHWDFPMQWFRRRAQRFGLTVHSFHCATYRFNPNGSIVHRLAYAAFRNVWPLTRFGWDMTVVLEKRR